jgi:transcriptional regulator with XRE-family HTH domain
MNISKIKKTVKKSVSTAVAYCGSQVELAKRAKVTQGAIGKYLREEALPKGDTAKRLSRAVDGTQKPCDFAPHIFDDEETDSAA